MLHTLEYIIGTRKELDYFESCYLKKCKTSMLAASRYREDVIRKTDMTFERFVGLYQDKEKFALEELFQHPINDSEIDLLHKKINERKITIEKLFSKHKDNPTYRFKRHLL